MPGFPGVVGDADYDDGEAALSQLVGASDSEHELGHASASHFSGHFLAQLVGVLAHGGKRDINVDVVAGRDQSDLHA